MLWIEHAPHPRATDSRMTYVCVIEDEYVAFITVEPDGFRAHITQDIRVAARGSLAKPYHYTHDTLDEAKEWCIAKLWERRLT